MTRAVLIALVASASAIVLAAVVPPQVTAATADAVRFGQPTSSSRFGEALRFAVDTVATEPLDRVELLLRFPDTLGPQVVVVTPPPGVGPVRLEASWDLADDGHLVPNTTVEATWRVSVEGDEATIESRTVAVTHADTRFDWRTVEGDVVRVHWYEGSDAFGQRALEIGEQAVRETTALLGVTEDEPIDFFIYPAEAPFRIALGPGTRENVGGQAHADIRTLFALITPGDINAGWVQIVVPHELVHLVFDTTVDNPYRFPPRWVNEGLAVYLSQGYHSTDRARVEQAVRSDALIPLTGLTGQFPTTFDRFALAYAESASALDHLVREHGRDALFGLVTSYREGLTDDEAFRRAIGEDVAGFQAGWFAELGAAEPARHGPQPAPAGPLPRTWSGGTPGEAGAPAPGSSTSAVVVVGGVAFAGLGVLAALVIARRRRTKPPAGAA